MKGPERLAASEDNWVTTVGLAFPGERVVFRGKDLFRECRNARWMELLLLGITGRHFTENQVRLFEAIWIISTSYPDPRIWNNRVASLAGTCRTTAALGIGAGIAVSEASIYGFKPIIWAHDFVTSLRRGAEAGSDMESLVLQALKKYRSLPGYARPLINQDERVVPLLETARELGLSEGVHVGIALEVERILTDKRYRMRMNIAALAAALAADQGLSAREYYHYSIPCFLAGLLPCFIEASARDEGTFLPLPCSRVTYEGRKDRKWGVP